MSNDKAPQAVEVLPCPFCGATWGKGLTAGYKGQPSTSWHVSCLKCRYNGPDAEGAHPDTLADAVEKWNRRFAIPPKLATDAVSREAVIKVIEHEAAGWHKQNDTVIGNAVHALIPDIHALPLAQSATAPKARDLARAAELLLRYAAVIRECHSSELERFDYLPEIEDAAKNVIAAAQLTQRTERGETK